MLHYRRFSEEVLHPVPASEAYVKREGGKGWPEQCPPVRAANAYGFDVLASVDLELVKDDEGRWIVERGGALVADWTWSPPDVDDDDAAEDGPPQEQEAAWGWDENQTLPHVITPEVAPKLRRQMKVSTFLYLATDPGEVLLFTDIPHLPRPFRVLPALVETDWYPASYAWHCVLEMDEDAERIVIERGEPLCRIVPVKRDTFFAKEMDDDQFGAFFDRGQAWLARHGKGEPGPMMDITGAYGRQQAKSQFRVVT